MSHVALQTRMDRHLEHAAMVFATVPGPAADRFFDELTARTAAPPESEDTDTA